MTFRTAVGQVDPFMVVPHLPGSTNAAGSSTARSLPGVRHRSDDLAPFVAVVLVSVRVEH